MKRLFISILALALPVTFALAEGHVVGAQQKPDPELQEKAVDPGNNFQFMVGDTVVISKSQTHYLSQKPISGWVYNVEHTILQIGTKKYPDGILLAGIMSWVAAGDGNLLLSSPVDRGDSTQNAIVRERVLHDKAVIDSIKGATTDTVAKENVLSEEQLRQIREAEERARQDSIAKAEAEALFLQKKMEEEQRRVADSVAKAVADSTEKVEHLKRLGAQHRLSIGVRGGVASLMQETENDVMGNWKAGFDGMLDLQYAYYFGAREGKSCNMGVITGASFGYARSPLKSGVDTTYTVPDRDATSPMDITYTIKASEVNEHDGQLQVEIPLLFSLRHESGMFFNVGPKIVIPVFSHYKQTISDDENTFIDAYFEDLGVHVTNEVITGKLQETDYTTTGKWKHSSISVVLTGELGYEWPMKNGDALGLGVYGNYAAYTAYNNATTFASLIDVGLPHAGGADVNVWSATDSYANKLGFFDCGVKLVYHFGFYVKK